MSSKTFYRQAVLILTLALACVPGVVAEARPIPHGTVELIAENTSIQPGHSFYAGLNFHLDAGWHIYWINPGDAGEPPRVTWHLPPGFAAQPIEWPLPKALPASSDMDFGYENQVLLLVPLTAGPSKISADIAADIKLIVCREVCIPGKAQVGLSLPVANGAAPPNPQTRELFEAARKQLPRPAPPSWRFTATSGKDSFQLAAVVGHPVQKAFLFPLEASQIENAAAQPVQPTRTGFTMTLKKSDQLLKPIGQLKGVLLVGARGYTVTAPVK